MEKVTSQARESSLAKPSRAELKIVQLEPARLGLITTRYLFKRLYLEVKKQTNHCQRKIEKLFIFVHKNLAWILILGQQYLKSLLFSPFIAHVNIIFIIVVIVGVTVLDIT